MAIPASGEGSEGGANSPSKDEFPLGGTDQEEAPPESPVDALVHRIKAILIGPPRSLRDPAIFHKISLIAFFAWVGLGADGLSSSAYGPDEAIRALGTHHYLAVALAIATALTVFIISYAYSRIVEHFPFGGGGYVVASKLLGPKFGVVSGSALLVDYVLTISVSIASGADQIFSFLPHGLAVYKMPVVVTAILLLTVLNLRGVKESVMILLPIFLLFVVTHAILILGGIAFHTTEAGRVASEIGTGYRNGLTTLGFAGMFALFLRAYSMGAGTYTGIEAVSNGIQIMREPKIETARRTMLYIAVSLAVTAGGILVCYLLYHVVPTEGKTMNAVLLENFTGGWSFGGLPMGQIFVMLTLTAEAALLFVAAQAGFIDGPRVMANMAGDSWMPHRFSSLSNRLTMQNGVILIAGAAILTLILTRGNTSALVLMYSINVFLTFSLSQMGMSRYWFQNRQKYPDWSRHIVIHLIGLVLCLSILIVNVYEKFTEGGWVTLVITGITVAFCLLIRSHYAKVWSRLNRLDEILDNIPLPEKAERAELQPRKPTAVLFVNSFSGLGIHSLFGIQRQFPSYFKNFVFVSINVVDAGSLKGIDDLQESLRGTERDLKKYVEMAERLGFAATYRMGTGTDVMEEAERITQVLHREFPVATFFTSKLIFQKERWYQRFLHNETANQLQRALQFDGLNVMVLPIRVFEK